MGQYRSYLEGDLGGLVTAQAYPSGGEGRIGTVPAGSVNCIADQAEPFGTLNIFDFLAFQTLFTNGDPVADIALPFGELNVLDFLEFHTAYGGGC